MDCVAENIRASLDVLAHPALAKRYTMATRYIHVDFAGTHSEATGYLAARPALGLLRVSRHKSPNGDCMIGAHLRTPDHEAQVRDQLLQLDPDQWSADHIACNRH